MTNLTKLKAEAQSAVDEAKRISTKADAEGRTMTSDERHDYDEAMTKGRDYLDKIKTAKADLAVLDAAKSLAAEIGLPVVHRGGERAASFGIKSGAAGIKSRDWAVHVAAAMDVAAASTGVKALTTGSIDVPNVIPSAPVPLPDNPNRVIDLLVNNVQLGGGKEYSFLRQTARTNNAAPVPDGAVKPTSVFTFTDVEGRAVVIAHLSEPIPERFFADHAGLIQVLEGEMHRGVLDAVEAQVMTGNGTGENLTGILNTSGIVSQPFSTSTFTTLRKARTGFQAREEVPTAWVFNPADIETFDLAQDAQERYYGLSLNNIFGALPQIVSSSVPAGTALLGDFNQCGLYVRDQLKLDADRSGELFTKNQVRLRAEGRFGFAVFRPQAFTVVDLTA